MRSLRSSTNLLAIAVVVLALLPLALTPAQAEDPPGKAVFVAQKCDMCHGIESLGIAPKSEKMKAADLSAVGSRMDQAAIASYLAGEAARDGANHKKPWKGTDEELKQLATWLASLKG
jgi:cytochrome c5